MNRDGDNPYAAPTVESARKPGEPQAPALGVHQAPAGSARYLVLLFLSLAATTAYIARNSIAVAESTIRGDLGLSKDAMGWVISGFFLTYALFQIPTGWLAGRWGSRRAISTFAMLWSLASAGMAFAGSFVGLFAMRLLGGMSQAGLFPACTNTISKWFPPHRRAFPAGALTSFMSAGGAIGVSLTGVLVAHLGWRTMFALYGIPGIVWAVWYFMWFRDRPEEHGGVSAEELAYIRQRPVEAGSQSLGDGSETEVAETGKSVSAEQHQPTPWLQLVSSPAMWWICTQQFFRAASYIFFASWFATYLQEARGVTIVGSGVLTMLPLLAVVVGGFCGGLTSDWVLTKTGSLRLARQGVAVTMLLICAGLIFCALLIVDPVFAVVLISGGSFFAAMAGPCSYTITIDMGGDHVPTVHSTMNMCGNFGALVFPIVVPWILRLTDNNWDLVLIVFGAMYIAAAAFWMLVKVEGTIFDQALAGNARRET